MPRVRRKGPARIDRLPADIEGARPILEGGPNASEDCFFEPWRCSDEAVAPLWRRHGPTVLADWVRRRPGTRPWAWWRFDAPESRRTRTPGRVPVPENQADYLDRLDLLTDAERERLGRPRRPAALLAALPST
jgi:hypothetical protein